MKIIVVDDNKDMREMVNRYLSACGHKTLEATSAEQALEILKGSPDIDWIVSDRQMDGMSGIELVAQAKRLYPATRSILMSGRLDDTIAVHAIEAGATHVLSKPFGPHQLLELISESVPAAATDPTS